MLGRGMSKTKLPKRLTLQITEEMIERALNDASDSFADHACTCVVAQALADRFPAHRVSVGYYNAYVEIPNHEGATYVLGARAREVIHRFDWAIEPDHPFAVLPAPGPVVLTQRD
jgi:hypothetical protein